MEHDKHRERMRQRYLSGGFNSFQEHELLEMLLFYAKPRGNTNPTAHALMERFGSLKNVMEASLDELKEVDGIGEQSAILFKLVTEFTRRYAIEAYRPKGYCFRDMKEIAMFIAPKFTGLDHEQLHMMLFNNRMNLLDHCIVSDGVVNSAEAPSRYIAERAYRKKAAFVILAHNHPNGIARPSPDDVDVTEYISSALNLLGITLIEHLIIVNFGFYPMIRNQARSEGLPPPIQGVSQNGEDLLDDLYDEETGVYKFEPLFCPDSTPSFFFCHILTAKGGVMMEAKQTSGCAIALGSLNRAIRARDLLASAALFSKIIKADGKLSNQGCFYALEVPCASLKKALDLLRRAGIKGQVLPGRK